MLGKAIKKKQSSIASFFKKVEKPSEQDSKSDEEFEKPDPKRLKTGRVILSDDESNNFIPPTTPAKTTKSLQSFSNSVPTAMLSSMGSHSTPKTTRSVLPAPTPSRSAKFKEKNEERYSWLSEIRDENGNTPDSEEYDPRTLYVPKSAWASFTPFEKQFWEIKSKHYDTVVFFKKVKHGINTKGKFFELYENDADVGHQQFDLKLTDRVNMRMVGVPESSFHHWASQFIAKGYKVAKVEQMENGTHFLIQAMGKSIRDKASSAAKDKVIKRELTSVLTTGTLVDGGFLTTDQSTFCMSIKETQLNDSSPPEFGICFVDTATAEFNVSFFTDDVNRTNLETLITQIKPKELVLEKGKLSKRSLKILKNNLDNSQYNFLVPEKEFWTEAVTRDELSNSGYFDNSRNMNQWPEPLTKIENNSIAISALGGLLSYLRTLKLDQSLASAGNFHFYDVVKSSSSLVLDGQTLINLEIFTNSYDGSDKGTLFKLLNNCVTPFGKRLFKKWVCHPLGSVDAINSRLDAVDDFCDKSGLLDDLREKLRKMIDLERVIARIHTGSCLVKDFVACLASLRDLNFIVDQISQSSSEFKSSRLLGLIDDVFSPNLLQSRQYFSDAFDHEDALKSGKIKLFEGYDEEFDAQQSVVREVVSRIEAYRKECEKLVGARISFKDIGKEVYQMELPCKVKTPANWTVMSKTKDVSRYYTPKLNDLIGELLEANEHCEIAMRNIKSRLYARFDEHYQDWMNIVSKFAEIDCLMSLAHNRKGMSEPCCRPEFIDSKDSVLEVEELRHPCIVLSDSDYIPNDLSLSSEKESMVLLTGPNMGGKSTLLRQTCIAVILAQLGSYVPAFKCRLTPFDRIFTRIGANDNIMAGQSTFMVELSETAKILKEATTKSLVILDELGRGTSTFDGYAIAYAVLHYLITHVGCLGLFSTHYGTLTSEFENNPLVALKYMSFFVDQDKVTFLYKLVTGKCPESYGMNVAKMAKIPSPVVDAAEEIAAEFDANHSCKKNELQNSSIQSLSCFKIIMEEQDPSILSRNCPVPEGMRSFEVITKIKDFVAGKSLKIASITAIGTHTINHQDSMLELQDCGVNLMFSAGNQSNTDVTILGEIMKTIYINKPPYCIILICGGDREFSKIIHFMIASGFRVVLVYASSISPVLLNSTGETKSWSEILGLPKPKDLLLRSLSSSASSSIFSDLKRLVDQHPEGILSWRAGQCLPLIYMINGFDSMKDYILAAEQAEVIQIVNRNDPSGNMILKPAQIFYSSLPVCPPDNIVSKLIPNQPCMMISESDSGLTLQNDSCTSFESLGAADEILATKFFPSPPTVPTLDQATAVSRALFVRNIHFGVKESEVLDYFKPFGDIKSHVGLISNRGLFFVVYYDLRDAVRAIDSLGSLEFKGREADLHFSVPKEGELPEKAQVGIMKLTQASVAITLSSGRKLEKKKVIDYMGKYGELRSIREVEQNPSKMIVSYWDSRAAFTALEKLRRDGSFMGSKLKGHFSWDAGFEKFEKFEGKFKTSKR